MLKKILLFIAILFSFQMMKAQVLYSEDFENLTIGAISNDLTGQNIGKGGWYTTAASLTTAATSDFKIESIPNKSKVLAIYGSTEKGANVLDKRELNIDWTKRNAANNVVKIEFDMYTDNYQKTGTALESSAIGLKIYSNSQSKELLTRLAYYGFNSIFDVDYIGTGRPSLKKSTWYKIEFFLDYANKKAYISIPSLNFVSELTFLLFLNKPQFTIANYPPNTIEISAGNVPFGWSGMQPINSKFDNFKITAINKVPFTLSTNKVISDKFNIYPNPSTDVLNITNTSEMSINELEIVDITGKTTSHLTDIQEGIIQLNIAYLSSGTYFLKIKTDQYVIQKKFIKK